MNFSEIRDKDVINIRDGRNLGKPIDLILNEEACIDALVVPGSLEKIRFRFLADRQFLGASGTT